VSLDVADTRQQHRRQSAAKAWTRRSRDRDRSTDDDRAAARRLEHRMVLLALLAAIATVVLQRWPGA